MSYVYRKMDTFSELKTKKLYIKVINLGNMLVSINYRKDDTILLDRDGKINKQSVLGQ